MNGLIILMGLSIFDVDFDQGDSAGEEAFGIVWRTEGGSDAR